MAPPRPQSIPDAELPCIEHGMKLESCAATMTELRDDVRDARDRLLRLETEWNSRARLVAVYVLPVALFALNLAFVLWRNRH